MTDSTTNRRYLYLDVLKILSCYLIILLHAIAGSVGTFNNSLQWIVADVLSSTTRVAVPVFVMVSGSLFLSKKIDKYFQFYKKYSKYYFPLLGGLVAYKINAVHLGDTSNVLDGVLFNVTNSRGYHLWYMWMFFGLLLVTPLLEKITNNKKTLKLFLGLWFLFCILVPLGGKVGIRFPISNQFFYTSTGYYVLGFALSQNKLSLPKSFLVGSLVLFIAVTAALEYADCLNKAKYVEFFYSMNAINILIISTSFFLLIKNIFQDKESAPIVANVSLTTSSVYIYHLLVMQFVTIMVANNSLACNVFVTTPLTFVLTFFLCYCCRQIPYFNKLF